MNAIKETLTMPLSELECRSSSPGAETLRVASATGPVAHVAQARLSVALVDGDEFRRSELAHSLSSMGHAPEPFDGMTGLLLASRGGQRFDLLLLNLEDGMTERDLLEACKRQPALLVAEDWQRKALQAINEDFRRNSAVDFMVSPFAGHELELRMRLLLRRTCLPAAQAKDAAPASYHFLERDNAVLHRGRRIQLTPYEFALALMLFRNPGRLLTREVLWTALRGDCNGRSLRSINTSIVGIRKKLALCPEHGVVLRSVYRQGYELCRLDASTTFDHSGP